ncbi:hypothetical protein Adt_42699 [Abeliophyllum distichum]|uniref:Uncharacterized protein n=1 Tax=Abeliophyllum distichum TaxID=126358 RepID=A0ABD1PSE2_9LAMI
MPRPSTGPATPWLEKVKMPNGLPRVLRRLRGPRWACMGLLLGLANVSDVRRNPSIQGESPLSSSSSEAVGEVNQVPPASCPSTSFASGMEVYSTVPLKKVGDRKRTDVGVSEMRGSLDKRDVPATRALDEELRRSATEASIARLRITAEELEDL